MATISFSSRQIGGGFVTALGILALLSALLLNPLVGRLIKGPLVVDVADVLLGYFMWASVLGGLLVAAGLRVIRGKSRVDDFALLLVLISGMILFDRMLLTRYGLTLWTYDSEIRYRHRPNVERTLAGHHRPDDRVLINRWGFHDTEFEMQKPAGEFRALMIGDSVTMGYGVTYAETFSAHLEKLLRTQDRKFSSHQAMNTGVHGYSTYQEKRVLERSLVFSPDIVFVGFCMNDVTEPFVADVEYGGTGLDYHGVTQTSNPVLGWLANETGLGRFMQTLMARGKTLEAERRLEVYNVRAMAAESRTSPKMQEAWRILLKDMSELYGVSAKARVPVVLVIFPYTFQLADEGLRIPQNLLAEHAARHGVDVIDTTEDFAKLVFNDPALVKFLRDSGKTTDEVLAYHRHIVDKYFLDEDHLTGAGHIVVAERLVEYLKRKGLVGVPNG